MKRIVLVDASQLTYACSNVIATKGLTDNLEDLVVRSIDKQIFDVTQGSQDYLPIIVFDSRPSFRLQIYPHYKGNRPQVSIDWSLIEKNISEHYLHLKYPLLEADDLIYLVSKVVLAAYSRTIIISSDSDMQQVVDKCNSEQYCPRTRKYKQYDSKYLWEDKVFLGDVSDNIPRILPKGVGPKTLEKVKGPDYDNFNILHKYKISDTDTNYICNAELVHFNIDTYKKYVSNIDELLNTLEKIVNL